MIMKIAWNQCMIMKIAWNQCMIMKSARNQGMIRVYSSTYVLGMIVLFSVVYR